MPALPFLTSTTSLSNWNRKQPALPFKSAPSVSYNTQSYANNKKAEKMHDQSVWTAAAETVFTQFNLFNPNRVGKMKGIQIKQKSNLTATSGSKPSSYVTAGERDREFQDGPETQFKAYWMGRPHNLKYFTYQVFSRGRRKPHSWPSHRVDILAWLENEHSFRQVRCISNLPIKQR